MKKISNISAVIIVKNGERSIRECLQSLTLFTEVVLYDTGSTDRTIEIAQEFANTKIIHGEFIGFGPTKNMAISYASNDWIFSLDADEVISPQLAQALQELLLEEQMIYSVLRMNYYKKQLIRYCWGADILIRLFNRQQTSFNQNRVHEDIIRNGLQVVFITGNLHHYPYQDISSFITKLDTYSTEFALANQGKRTSSPLLALTNAVYSFFKTYFLKRGFLDGSAGVLIAFSHAATNFYKYMKLYELNKQLSN